jgi:hypothetical protein
MDEEMIDMATAAGILLVSGPAVSRRLILAAGIPTENRKNRERWARRSDVERLARERGGRRGPGRRKKTGEIVAKMA